MSQYRDKDSNTLPFCYWTTSSHAFNYNIHIDQETGDKQ